MFGIGNEPTGDKDPFGLRRAALGILRIVIEGRLPLLLPDLVATAFAAFEGVSAVKPAAAALEDFIYDRLRGSLRDQGFTANQIAAVVDARPAELRQVPVRLDAVRAFELLPEAAAPRGGQQAHRQHPAQVGRRGRRRGRPARCSPTAPSATSISRSSSSDRRSTPSAPPATMRPRCRRSPRRSLRWTGSSTP